MRVCRKCKIEKPFSEYYKAACNKDGYKNTCKICENFQAKLYKREYYKIPENRLRMNKVDNISRIRRKLNNPIEFINKKKISDTKYYRLNKDKIDLQKKEYRARTKDARNTYIRKWQKEQNETNIQFKLARMLRSRVRAALKNNKKSGSAVKDLGCSLKFLKDYLENKFKKGMTWDNHGKWHLDHIKPLIKFDLLDRREFLEAIHYTNLQPLWAKENMSKGGF